MLVLRVAEPGRPAFQLRKGEQGTSVFLPDSVQPPLTETEILAAYRPGRVVVARTDAEIMAIGLQIVPVPGGELLPDHLRTAHAEIQPMGRPRFKQALLELE